MSETTDSTTKTTTVIRDVETTLPPARPGVRYVRVPMVGIVIADDDVRRRVTRFFHWPMIVLALLVLPLLLIEHLYLRPGTGEPVVRNWLWWACWVAFSVIWIAFLVEFLVKIAIAECRIRYVKRNWLDVVIIIVPVLRPLRAMHLAKTGRVFTLKRVGLKFARYAFTIVIGLDATEKLLARIGMSLAANRRDPQDMTREELVDEVRELRRLTDRWEAWHRAHEEHLARHGEPGAADGFTLPKPEPDSQPAS